MDSVGKLIKRSNEPGNYENARKLHGEKIIQASCRRAVSSDDTMSPPAVTTARLILAPDSVIKYTDYWSP